MNAAIPRGLAVLILALSCVLAGVPRALAQAGAAQAGPAPPAPVADASAAARPAASAPQCPPDFSVGTQRFSVALDSDSQWQPRDRSLRFRLSGEGVAETNVHVVACFRWRHLPGAKWQRSFPVRYRRADAEPEGTVSFQTVVPRNMPDAPAGWPLRLMTDTAGDYSWFGIVPWADLLVTGYLDNGGQQVPVAVVVPFGITSAWGAFWTAAVAIAGFGLMLYWLARARGICTTRSFFLTLITTKSGYASLSQCQILLWTFVIGGGAVYVMAMSGTLIDIPTGALALLGIAGVSAIGSKLQSHQEESHAGGQVVPSRVEGLSTPASTPAAPDVVLTWHVPLAGGPAYRYLVQYRRAGSTAWSTASASIRQNSLRVVRLDAGDWQFQVSAANAAGSGQPSEILALALAPPAAAVDPQIAAVRGLTIAGEITAHVIPLRWDPAGADAHYLLRYRRHESDEDWRMLSVTAATAQLEHLAPAADYDIEVMVQNAATRGAAAYLSARTLPRTRVPLWSDLVVVGDGQREIDVTRVQMLFFTVVSALFVSLKIVTNSAIPEIPEGFFILMGISNGVYLTAKFVPE